MPATIRLTRVGKKGNPAYRIVVVDKRKKRDGSYIEKIGLYQPLTNPITLTIDQKRFTAWVNKGAVLSEGIKKLLTKLKRV